MPTPEPNAFQQYLQQHRLLRYAVYAIVFAAAIGTVGYHAIVQAINTQTLAGLPCSKTGSTHEVVVNDVSFQPREVMIARCDQLVFVNRGNRSHWPAFGKHPKHLIYPGYHERVLRPGQSNAVTPSVPGTYLIHDHLDERIEGRVVVKG